MPPPDEPNDALYALHLKRQSARRWGLITLAIALIVGAIAAPHTTLLALLALVVFGAFGVAVAWALRRIDRLFNPPRS